MLINIGVFVSLVARKAAPSTVAAFRNSIGRLTIKKYADAGPRTAFSAPIQTGMKGASTTDKPPVTAAHPTTKSSACRETRRIISPSFLPTACAIIVNTPTPTAPATLLTSHVIVVVTLTAAVACSPSRPTIAVSTYCNKVASTSSKTVGIDKVTSVHKISVFRNSICFTNSS